MDNLNASPFLYNKDTYELGFEKILAGITACYKMMINDNVAVPPNDENRIRDILLLKYLNKNAVRNVTQLTYYLFDREVPEDNTDGRVDIKIQTLNTFIDTDAYYIIECKRLDNQTLTGTSGLNGKYIKDGIMRFVGRKYSTYYRINGMIGFVIEKMDISGNITNINTLLRKIFPKANTKKELTVTRVIDNFTYQYYSEHRDVKNNHIKLYHLMFDFSRNLERAS